MVEGKISKMGHEPYNVQIVFEEYSSDASFQLCDKDGKFLTVPSADANHCSEGDEPYEEMASGSFGEERNEVELLCQSVTDITRERDELREELETTKQQLELKKARVKELWRMSCEQVAEHDALILAKDEEIARLKVQLAERVRVYVREVQSLQMRGLFWFQMWHNLERLGVGKLHLLTHSQVKIQQSG